MQTQSIWSSFIFVLSFISALAEAVLGVMLSCDAIDPQLAGSIMTGLSVMLAWGSANNPSSKNEFIMKPQQPQPHVLPQRSEEPYYAEQESGVWFNVEDAEE